MCFSFRPVEARTCKTYCSPRALWARNGCHLPPTSFDARQTGQIYVTLLAHWFAEKQRFWENHWSGIYWQTFLLYISGLFDSLTFEQTEDRWSFLHSMTDACLTVACLAGSGFSPVLLKPWYAAEFSRALCQ